VGELTVFGIGRETYSSRPHAWLALPGDTKAMLRTANWLARVAGYALVGALTFISPPRGAHAVQVQTVCYALLGVALVAWALVDAHPVAMRHRARALPVILGVIAVITGFAAGVGGGGGSMLGFTFTATMTAGFDIDLQAAVTIAAAGALSVVISGLAYGASVGTLLGYPLLLVVALLIGRNRRAYRVQAEQSAALLDQYEQLQTEQRRADVLDERARIAREIHDVLAHSLGALGIQIQAAKAVLTDHRDVDRAIEVLTTAQRMAADGLAETRRAVHALRVDTKPLDEELARVTDAHGQHYHVPVTLGVDGTPRPLPADATIALLRTAQEALVNAAKHAAGQSVAVRLDYGEHDVRLTVVNDLADRHAARPPATSTVNGGYGLTGMRERLQLLNGTLVAGPRDDRWSVTAELPLGPAPHPQKPQPQNVTS
jgi:signal transduction histidine kinase